MLPSKISRRVVLIPIILVFAISPTTAFPFHTTSPDSPTGITELISLSYTGGLSEGHSSYPVISQDNRYIAFESWADNLILGGSHLKSVYVRDLQSGTNEIVSISTIGEQTQGQKPSISGDGRFVAFDSPSGNLVPNDTNNCYDIFVFDRDLKSSERVSISSNNDQANANSFASAISANGLFVAYHSEASNLVDNDSNYRTDVFIRNRQVGSTELISFGIDGTQSNMTSRYPSVSADGRYVAFESNATNLVPNDSNGAYDIFVRDRQSQTTERVSMSSDGIQGNNNSHFPNISANGRYVVFESYANNLAPNDTNILLSDIFLHDRETGTTELISRSLSGTSGNNWSAYASVSDDGIQVAFASVASNLVPDDTNGIADDIFVCDRPSGQITRASVSTSGLQENGASHHPRIAADGSTVTFDSAASNLVDGDTNGVTDIFLHRLDSESTDLDLSILDVVAVQSIEEIDLVENKNTAIKVVIGKIGDLALNNVLLSLRIGDTLFERFFVSEQATSDNYFKLSEDQTQYPLDFPGGVVEKTIYFFDPSHKILPLGESLTAHVEIDSLNVIHELNEENNTRSLDAVVSEPNWSGWLFPDFDIRYFRAETSGLSNNLLRNFLLYSDNYMRASFPISQDKYISKFYENFDGNISSCSWFGMKCDGMTLSFWALDTLTLLRLADQTADRFVGILPVGWFEQNTLIADARGFNPPLARQLVIAEALRLGDMPNGIAIVAHEIGHSYGLEHREDDNQSASPGLYMTDLESYIIEPTETRKISRFMVAKPTDYESWFDYHDYQHILERTPVISNELFNVASSDQYSILAAGMFDIQGNVTLENWYIRPATDLTVLSPGPYSFEYFDSTGNLLFFQDFDVDFTLDYGVGVSEAQISHSPFVLSLPYIPETTKILIKKDGNTLAERIISANSPTVVVTAPAEGEFSDQGITITWEGDDSDGDPLSYVILYSSDNGLTWNPIALGVKDSNYEWDTRLLPPGSGYKIKVIVTDGFNTGEDETDSNFTILGKLFLPSIGR